MEKETGLKAKKSIIQTRIYNFFLTFWTKGQNNSSDITTNNENKTVFSRKLRL